MKKQYNVIIDRSNSADAIQLRERETIMTKATNKASTKIAAANSETIVAATTKAPAAEVIAAPTKADKAREIFGECYGMEALPQRKDIIARAVAEAGLTKAGAATYLQNYKNKNGLSTKRTAATA